MSPFGHAVLGSAQDGVRRSVRVLLCGYPRGCAWWGNGASLPSPADEGILALAWKGDCVLQLCLRSTPS